MISVSDSPVFEHADHISTTMLRDEGALYIRSVLTITFKSFNSKSSFRVLTFPYLDPPYIRLQYSHGKEDFDYRIELELVPSNLGVGMIWYFKCPGTGKRARKLYRIGKYFLHREAYRGVYYINQTQSRKWREFHSHIKKGGDPYFVW